MKKIIALLLVFCGLGLFSYAGNYGCSNVCADALCISSVEFFEDQNHLSFEDIRVGFGEEFRVYNNQELLRDKIYWFRIVIDNRKRETINYFIHFNCMISNVELYEIMSADTYQKRVGGVFVPQSQRSVPGYIKDKLHFIAEGQGKTILYIRLLNQLEKKYTLKGITIVAESEYIKETAEMGFLQGAFQGMMVILTVLNLIFFAFSRNKLYLYYALYIVFTALFFFNNFQFSEKYLFFNNPKIDLALYWSIFIAQFIYLMFFLELLKNDNVPVWRKYVKYYAWFICLYCIVILIYGQIDYYIAIVISDFYTILNAIFVIATFFMLFKSVKLTTKIVLTGSFIMVIGALITTVISFSELAVSNLFYYQIGVAVELVLFTLAVNYTYHKERLQSIKVLYEKELEKHQKEKENQALRAEVEHKNRALTTKVMMLSEKETLISGLIEQLEEMNKDDNSELTAQNLIHKLKINLSNDPWPEFELHFNEVYPQFYSCLSKSYPGLTPNERKLCAFLKLNLSTKNISNIIGKSQNTIDVARSRLRKKMGLSNDENLQTLIANIC